MPTPFDIGFMLLAALGVAAFFAGRRKSHRIALYAWRVEVILTIASALMLLFTEAGSPPFVGYAVLAITFFLRGMVLRPLFDQAATCQVCGQRIRWAPIVTSRCPHCDCILYKSYAEEVEAP